MIQHGTKSTMWGLMLEFTTNNCWQMIAVSARRLFSFYMSIERLRFNW